MKMLGKIKQPRTCQWGGHKGCCPEWRLPSQDKQKKNRQSRFNERRQWRKEYVV